MTPVINQGDNDYTISVHTPTLNSSIAGVIIMFNNYTGDRLNFGIAVERAKSEGIKVGVIINGDDCAIDSANRVAGRRGLNGGLANMKVSK